MRTPFSTAAALGLLALAPGALGACDASAQPGPALTAVLSSMQISYGAAVSITGRLAPDGQTISGAPLALQANSYPFRGYETIATATSGSNGSYSFTGVRPNRNTRLRVIDTSTKPERSSGQYLIVNPLATTTTSRVGPGAVKLSLSVGHTDYADSPPVAAYWYLAPATAAGSASTTSSTTTSASSTGTTGPVAAPDYRLEAVTQTVESGRLTTASATVDPPSAAFTYRVCFSPEWRHSMGTSASYRPCVVDSGLALQGHGSGDPTPSFPTDDGDDAARQFLNARAGRTAFAVVSDTGAISGLRIHEHFETASVVKVMMLVSYLQMLSAEHRDVDAASNAILYPMIHISDNDAASAVFEADGGYPALEKIAAQAGMTDFVPGVGWWAYTETSAADQARFLFELDGLIPAQFDSYARGLLAGIEAEQSWGVPPIARPEYQVYFKTGALPSRGLFNEAALLQRGPLRFALCVLTDGDPSMPYGEESIQGVGSALLDN